MKHTPGPWYYTANDANGGMVTDRRGTQIAWTLSGDPVENCANSCLIAAAPELLAALQAMLHRFGDAADKPTPAELLAKAAITKATGAEHATA